VHAQTPTYAVTLQLLGHRRRGRHRPAGGPSAIALACTLRLADGGHRASRTADSSKAPSSMSIAAGGVGK